MFRHPVLREFTQRDGIPMENVMNGITTLSERAESLRGGVETGQNLLAAIAAELTPGRRDKDLVLAARELHNDCSKAEIHAQHLQQQIADRDQVIGLRDADVDQLKIDLAAMTERYDSAIATGGSYHQRLEHANDARAFVMSHLENIADRVEFEAAIITDYTPRRARAARSAAQRLTSTAERAKQVIDDFKRKPLPTMMNHSPDADTEHQVRRIFFHHEGGLD